MRADPPEVDTRVEWRPFDEDAFREAADADRPVLLSLSAHWCRSCHEMDREVYAEPGIGANVNDGFVPIRVDVDRHPRIRDRYNMGGFPSTVFLTPAGEVITGATALSPEAFRSVIDRVREVWAEKGDDAGRIPRSLRTVPPAGEVTADIERLVAGQLREQFDPDFGGWGTEAKFPLPRTIEFALKREPELATRTLDPIRQHLVDTYEGGFFRYAAGRDWSDPHREKLADENAALLRAFANAYLHTGDDAYRRTAEDAVTFLTTTLWTGEAVAGSQAPGDPEYYRLAPSDREAAGSPPVDDTVFADRNGLAVDALLAYHAYTDDESARRYAERALDHLAGLIDDGAVSHYAGEAAPSGLLFDQARVAAAFATAAQVLGGPHVETATTVADHAIETLLTDDGVVDGPLCGPGLLDRPLYSIDGAAELANALVDLAALTGESRYRAAAREAVAAFADASDRFGVQVAGYATAAARVLEPPLRIEVATPAGSDLHRAALRIADHEKVVVPGADGPPGTATAVIGGDAAPPVDSPDDLVATVSDRVD